MNAVLLSSLCLVLSAQPSGEAPVDLVKDELLRALNAQDAAKLHGMFGGPMKAALPLDKTTAFVAGVIAKRGKISSAKVLVPGKNRATYTLEAERGLDHR